MSPTRLLIALSLVAAGDAYGGRIYGSIQVNGQPAPPGTRVTVNCSDSQYGGSVQNHGRYSVNAAAEGRCTVSLPGYQNVSAKATSYSEATRYDFAVSGSPGSYSMRRK